MTNKINTDMEKQLVNELKQDFYNRREARKPLELQWRLNMNFYNGNQYCQIAPNGELEEYGKQFFWQEREVYNHIASIVETRIAKLTRTNVSLSARPMSGDDADINTAKMSSKIIKAVCEESNLTRLINTAVSWSEVTGTCFFRVIWNGEKGRIIGNDKAGNPIKEGEVEMSVIPPFEIFPDNLCVSKLEECMSIIHAKAYNIKEIEDAWGVRVEGEEVNVFSIDNSMIGGGLGYEASVPNIISQSGKDYCLVIERYERPSKDFPQGRHMAIAGDKLLFCNDLPFVNSIDNTRTFPFCKIICLEKVGNLFGTSIVERMIPLQRSYNAVKNRKHEFLNRISMGVLAVEDGSVDLDNLEEEGLSPGKVLIYRQGSAPPRLMDSGNIPNDFAAEEDRLLNEFITISGVSELSKYSQTFSSMSGKAISLLVQQDETRLSIASSSIRQAIMQISEFVLRLYKQYATNPRLKRVCGDNGDVELAYFNSNNLQSENLAFDTENEMTDSLVGRRTMALELINMGLLVDESGKISNRNKLKILELMGFGNWEAMRDISECHRKKAAKENLHAEKSIGDCDELDDHEIHIDEHLKIMLSDSTSKKVADKLRAHIKTHKQWQNYNQTKAQEIGNE